MNSVMPLTDFAGLIKLLRWKAKAQSVIQFYQNASHLFHGAMIGLSDQDMGGELHY
jgi:hypothetical protein